MIELDPGPNEERIDRLYAFLSVDENGKNGVVASIVPGIGAAQMIFGSRRLAHKQIPKAQEIAKLTGKKIGLFVFERVKDVDYWMSDE